MNCINIQLNVMANTEMNNKPHMIRIKIVSKQMDIFYSKHHSFLYCKTNDSQLYIKI
jgi:hypothetical protein